jgi:hypothetical protein
MSPILCGVVWCGVWIVEKLFVWFGDESCGVWEFD